MDIDKAWEDKGCRLNSRERVELTGENAEGTWLVMVWRNIGIRESGTILGRVDRKEDVQRLIDERGEIFGT